MLPRGRSNIDLFLIHLLRGRRTAVDRLGRVNGGGACRLGIIRLLAGAVHREVHIATNLQALGDVLDAIRWCRHAPEARSAAVSQDRDASCG